MKNKVRFTLYLAYLIDLCTVSTVVFFAPNNPKFGTEAILIMARIIHFGEDSCHRLMVLEGVGYAVERCESIQDLEYYLRSADRPDAVIISSELGGESRVARCVSNAELPLPVILFAGSDESNTEFDFDLVIPALTAPRDWLSKIEETIERFHVQRLNVSAHSNGQRAGHTRSL
jgi:hypothetical protein